MSTIEVRVPGDVHAAVLSDVTRAQEWAGYLLCGVSSTATGHVLLGREWHPVPEHLAIPATGHGFSWSPDFDIEMLNIVQRNELACVILHYHGGAAPRLGRTSDQETAKSLMPFLSREATGRPHLFAVLGDRTAVGVAYLDGYELGNLTNYRVSSTSLDDWPPERSPDTNEIDVEIRHDRLVRGFGRQAHLRLRKTTVGVVGCGGGGSHVVQQLAYLGVGALVLIDADFVEETNLNRLIGAVPSPTRRLIYERLLRRNRGDVGQSKLAVMERLVRAVDPSIKLTLIEEAFPTTRTVQALRNVDIVVACLDQLQPREDLNRFCKRYLIPMLDIGIEIHQRDNGTLSIPGRVTKILADGPCLRCQGVITDQRLEDERGGRPIGYASDLHLPDPAVVTLNGVIASLAATEVLQLVTGFAGPTSPNCGWIFDGVIGSVEPVRKLYVVDAKCEWERGWGDIA